MRDSIFLAVTVGVIGVSFGALASASGTSPAMTCATSALVFAGGSQFATLGVLVAGGSPLAALASALLLNARYVPFGMAVAARFLGGAGRLRRAIAAHFLVDESAALALAQADPAQASRAFWWCGALLFVAWNAGTAAGALAGPALGDPRAIGLDAAFPAGLLALLAPQLRTRRGRASAGIGALVAIAMSGLLPPGLPVLAAALAPVVAVAIPEREPAPRVPS